MAKRAKPRPKRCWRCTGDKSRNNNYLCGPCQQELHEGGRYVEYDTDRGASHDRTYHGDGYDEGEG